MRCPYLLIFLLVIAPLDFTSANEKPRPSPNIGNYELPVRCLRVTSDGKTVITVAWRDASRKRPASKIEVSRWSLASGERTASVLIDRSKTRIAALSRDGKLVATAEGSWDDKPDFVLLWDAATGKLIREFSHGVTYIAFSPDGRQLASGSADGVVQVWDVRNGRVLHSTKHDYGVSAIAFSRDGSQIISGSSRGVILCGPGCDKIPWGDLKLTGSKNKSLDDDFADPVVPAFSGGVRAVKYSRDGRWVAVVNHNQICFWDSKRKQLVATFASPKKPDDPDIDVIKAVHALAFSPDGRLLATGCECQFEDGAEHQVWIWELASGKPIAAIKGHRERIQDVAFSPNGRFLISAAAKVKVWDLHDTLADQLDLKLRHHIKGHNYFLVSVAFSPDGKTLASGAVEGTVKLWDVTTGKQKRVMDMRKNRDKTGFEVHAVAFHPDGKRLVVAGGNQLEYGEALVYDLESDKLLQEFRGHHHRVTSIALSRDGQRLATISHDDRAIVWDMKTGKQITNVTDLDTSVADVVVALSPDGKLLATRYWPATMWDATTGGRVGTVEQPGDRQPYSISFSPDGQLFATGNCDGTVSLWDSRTRDLLATTHWHLWTVHCVAFAPNGKWLAVGSESGKEHVEVFDASLPWKKGLFSGIGAASAEHEGRVHSVAFNSQGNLLATSSVDGVLRIWEVRDQARRASTLTLDNAWEALKASDPVQAYRAIRFMVDQKEKAAAFLKPRIASAKDRTQPKNELIDRLIAEIDSDKFDVRETATRQLKKLGVAVEPKIQAAIKTTKSFEVRQRLKQVLDSFPPASPIAAKPEVLRRQRAVWVLEQLGASSAGS